MDLWRRDHGLPRRRTTYRDEPNVIVHETELPSPNGTVRGSMVTLESVPEELYSVRLIYRVPLFDRTLVFVIIIHSLLLALVGAVFAGALDDIGADAQVLVYVLLSCTFLASAVWFVLDVGVLLFMYTKDKRQKE